MLLPNCAGQVYHGCAEFNGRKRHNVIADKVSDMVHPDAVFGPLLSIKSFCGTWTYPAHQSTKSLWYILKWPFRANVSAY